jgi:hypothetical protein
VLGLAALLAAATAAAEAVVVAEEVVPCSVVSADSGQPYAWRLDTLARNASPAVIAARCRDMYAALRECGRSDRTIAELLREVSGEQATLRRLWPWAVVPALCLSGTGLGGCTGVLIGEGIRPTGGNCGIGYGLGDMDIGGGPVGCLVGSVAGSLGGAAIGIGYRAVLIARHRNRVNDLVRKVNRAIASPP